MPFGPAMPRQAPTVQLLPVAAFKVGTLGKMRSGLSDMMASARTLPASISARASGREQVTNSTPPAIRSFKPGAAPWEGTHGDASAGIRFELSMPASAKCQMPPWPVPLDLYLPGLFLIAVKTSLTVL